MDEAALVHGHRLLELVVAVERLGQIIYVLEEIEQGCYKHQLVERQVEYRIALCIAQVEEGLEEYLLAYLGEVEDLGRHIDAQRDGKYRQDWQDRLAQEVEEPGHHNEGAGFLLVENLVVLQVALLAAGDDAFGVDLEQIVDCGHRLDRSELE